MVIVAALFLTGCGNGGTEPATGQEVGELEKVTVVLDWVPNTNHTGLYTAVEMGYFEEAGIEADIIQPSHGGSADLIGAGQGEFGISYQEEVTYARTAEDPLPVKAIAAIIQNNTSGFASPAEKGIERPRDFEGKDYGGWGSPVEESMIKALMDNDGGDFDEVGFVNIGTSDFFDGVENHVDFSWIYYGWDGIAAELRDYDINFILLQDYEPALNFYTPVIIAHEELLDQDPELARGFLAAVTKGYEYAINHPEEAAQHLLAHVPEMDEEMVIASQQYLANVYQADADRWGEMKLEVWETYALWMYDQELLSQALDAEKAFTNEFLPGGE
ncbi:MAG: ABC transporter substrate-binding protein [Tindallia sp. MSAO_Bac2]|nr:MAG: ABC transporter substrate-binding protein [Tindallia sp. MSAO_Bac2]